MDSFMQWANDTWQHFAADPTQQVHTLLGVIATGVAYLAFRRRKRCRVTIDCPPGEKVFVQIGEDDLPAAQPYTSSLNSAPQQDDR